jgi:hypothetical protein
MYIKLCLAVVFALIFSGCTTTHEELKGHWHSVNKNDLTVYSTLDINDSLVIIDANALVGLNKYKLPIFDKDNTLSLPLLLEDYYPEGTSDFYLKNDTLYIGSKKVKYVRSKLDTCLSHDFFSDLFVNMNLKNCSCEEVISLHDLQEKYLLSHISVGRFKNRMIFSARDSTVIQVNDVIISPFDLQEFVNQEKDIFDAYKLNAFCLNIDKDANQAVVDSIYLNLEKVLTLRHTFKSCLAEGIDKIMYEKCR